MSLGWLSQSSILPRKGRSIEGVSSSSLVELKATLFDTQSKATQKVRSREPASSSKMELKNRGVEERSQKDYIEFQKETDYRSSLERKAQIYEQQQREGTASSSLVDFERKAWEQEDDNEADDMGASVNRRTGGVDREAIDALMESYNPFYQLEREAVEDAWDSEEEDEKDDEEDNNSDDDDDSNENLEANDSLFSNKEPEDEQERRKMEMAREIMNVARNTAQARARVQKQRRQKQRMIAQRLAKSKIQGS
eukprot:gb/GECH01000440.1/.p1 GENE.gb/GECH01000440.1/~~gb/GECH01000440.1/.p1  ORF type:complete len:252 (+),score=97.12 gb/GECH01000440.1/:1-756(+)